MREEKGKKKKFGCSILSSRRRRRREGGQTDNKRDGHFPNNMYRRKLTSLVLIISIYCATSPFRPLPSSSSLQTKPPTEEMQATSTALSPCPPKSQQPKYLKKSRSLRVSSDHSSIDVRSVSYRPPGTEHNLLNEVSFSLPQKSFGLIFGRSGSGKTTLLQLLAGFSKPTSGSICVQNYGKDGCPSRTPEILPPERVGIVFQFPERFFLADTVIEEITFGWPRKKSDFAMREQLALKLQYAINSVGLNTIPLDEDPHSLSGGFKRRLALAIQLVKKPDLLLLDEPLAGLDWKARADVVKLLKHLKKELTLLVVSHDLKELSGLVDVSWRMEMGGRLKEETLPV